MQNADFMEFLQDKTLEDRLQLPRATSKTVTFERTQLQADIA
jgi:hypothetical protein